MSMLRPLALLFAIALLAAPAHAQDGKIKIEKFNHSEWTKGIFSEAVTVTNIGNAKFVYLAGVGAEDENGKRGDVRHHGDFLAQCKYSYDKIKRVLAHHGATLGDVVKITTYMTDLRHRLTMGKCIGESWGGVTFPVHTLIGVSRARLPGNDRRGRRHRDRLRRNNRRAGQSLSGRGTAEMLVSSSESSRRAALSGDHMLRSCAERLGRTRLRATNPHRVACGRAAVGMGIKTMNPVRAFGSSPPAQPLSSRRPSPTPQPPRRSSLTEKINAYVGCINRLSERSYEFRKRYFSWAAQSGPTGKERIIYGTYTIYDTTDCKKNVEKANALEPRDAALEAAASAYADAVGKLEPLLKEADDYYSQENYKDDRMAKGMALHPRLVAAWDAIRERRQGAAQRRRSHQRQARGRAPCRDRAEGRPQGALPCRGADDPRQARAARGGDARIPTSPRSRRR